MSVANIVTATEEMYRREQMFREMERYKREMYDLMYVPPMIMQEPRVVAAPAKPKFLNQKLLLTRSIA